MENFKPMDIIEGTIWNLCFWFEGHIGGWGYSFECDESGAILPGVNTENLAACQSGMIGGEKVVPGGIVGRSFRKKIPASGKCSCGMTIELPRFTNTCSCGKDYNSSGQELGPRENWGAETSEHLSDILRIE